ncbi:YadA-like family protein [Paraburkholderia kururiensis]|uniref:YadA-like family protein n=1 Tax=Paraburkholderia kururiensis TaxID=984307 RepID=UPI003084352C
MRARRSPSESARGVTRNSAAALGFSAQIANNLKIKGGVSGGAGGYSYGASASYQW